MLNPFTRALAISFASFARRVCKPMVSAAIAPLLRAAASDLARRPDPLLDLAAVGQAVLRVSDVAALAPAEEHVAGRLGEGRQAPVGRGSEFEASVGASTAGSCGKPGTVLIVRESSVPTHRHTRKGGDAKAAFCSRFMMPEEGLEPPTRGL